MKKLFLIAATSMISFASTSALAIEPTDRSTLTDVGDIVQFAVPLAAAGISLYKGDSQGLYQHAEGALYTSLATHILKFAINRERPNGGSHSFPSGHTSAAMQGAAYLQFRYGWKYGLPATAAAALVGYSRIDANYHHKSDVFAGTALAWGTQYLISEMGISPTKLLISPFVMNKGGFGMNVSSRF